MEYGEPCMRWPRTLRAPQGLGSKLYPVGSPIPIEMAEPSTCGRTTFGSGRDLAEQLLPIYVHLSCFLVKRSEVLLTSVVGENCEPQANPSLEVTPCKAKPKSVGENFANRPFLSKIQTGL